MRSIAIMNQKGGVGKTTTAVNLSAALAATGLRVCLLDLDPQAHATLHLGIEPKPDELSIYHVLTGETRIGEVVRPAGENLWLIPSSLDLAAAELQLVGMVGREGILRDKLRDDPPEVDYLLIDCPPSLGILTLNALAAVGEVFIPLQPHFLALHGLSKLLETIDLVAATPERPVETQRRDPLHVRRRHAAGGRGEPGRGRVFPECPRTGDPVGRRAGFPDADSPQRASGRVPPASASRSSSTPPTRTAPRTTGSWLRRSQAARPANP